MSNQDTQMSTAGGEVEDHSSSTVPAVTPSLSTSSPSPLAMLQTHPPPDALPDGWIVHKSRSQPGYVYYFNQFTGEKRWDLPFAAVGNLEGIKETIENLANLAKKETEQLSRRGSHGGSDNGNGDGNGDKNDGQDPRNQNQRSILKKTNTTSRKRDHEAASGSSSSGGNINNIKKKSRNEQVRVLHILKKHNRSRNPASWRQAKITISKDEAKDELRELMAILDESKGDPKELRATFEELAKTESDCSSAKRGGDVGFFGRKKMQPNFESASFGLAIGGMSGIVETSSGVHVILRLG